MVELAGELLDVLMQRAPVGHVQLLMAPAQGEQRDARVDGAADERQRRRVPARIVGDPRAARRGAVALGRHVGRAAGEDQTVDRGQERVDVQPGAERRDQERQAAGGLGDGRGVLALHAVVADRSLLAIAAADSDHRTHRPSSDAHSRPAARAERRRRRGDEAI